MLIAFNRETFGTINASKMREAHRGRNNVKFKCGRDGIIKFKTLFLIWSPVESCRGKRPCSFLFEFIINYISDAASVGYIILK